MEGEQWRNQSRMLMWWWCCRGADGGVSSGLVRIDSGLELSLSIKGRHTAAFQVAQTHLCGARAATNTLTLKNGAALQKTNSGGGGAFQALCGGALRPNSAGKWR
ncbi:hypothetical protein NQZ68_007692 [Dissostichus eleginoides]|nr:hypothetical protein NQZ68_007692 [Dissostichus eleginoides]